MMKKLLSLLLAIILVCSLGTAVFAAEDAYTAKFYQAVQDSDRYDDVEFTVSVPVHRLSYDYESPFEEIYEKASTRAVGIYRDGVLTTEELRFYENEDGSFSVGQHFDQSDLGALVAAYGNELLILNESESMRFVIFLEDPQTMYLIEELLKENPEAYPYTYADYQKAVGYRLNYKGEGVLGDVGSQSLNLSMGDTLMEQANSYWDYIENQPIYERNFAIVFFSVIAVIAVGLVALGVYLSKRRKKKAVSRE